MSVPVSELHELKVHDSVALECFGRWLACACGGQGVGVGSGRSAFRACLNPRNTRMNSTTAPTNAATAAYPAIVPIVANAYPYRRRPRSVSPWKRVAFCPDGVWHSALAAALGSEHCVRYAP